MIFYQILSAVCFTWFTVNVFFLLYLHYYYNIPKTSERYMFLSLFKNIVGAISQLYSLPYNCDMAWYTKCFAIAVCFASFFWCIDKRNTSSKKIRKIII